MHIVIAGDEETAIRLAETLMIAHDVVLVSERAIHSPRLERLDIHVVAGSPTSVSVLREAACDQADFFVAASEDDERNIVACLAADRLGAKFTICFLVSSRGAHFESSDDISLAESIGLGAVIRPTEQLAEEIVRIVTVPGALDARSFHGGRVHLLKCSIGDTAKLAGKTLRQVKLPRGARLVVIQRGQDFFIPRGDTTIRPGDRVTAMGTRRALGRLHRELFGQHSKNRRAIITGGGQVGASVARGLHRVGWNVKLIEENEARCEQLAADLDCMILHGDGSDIDLLEQEHIDSVAALIAVTNNDERNLLISLVAKQLGVPRIITRADRSSNERVFERVGIDVVLSTRGAALRSVAADIVDTNKEQLADLEHGDYGVLQFELPDDFIVTHLYDVSPPGIATVGAVLRGGKTIIPMGQDELRPGDFVLIFCKIDEKDVTRDYFMRDLRRQQEAKK